MDSELSIQVTTMLEMQQSGFASEVPISELQGERRGWVGRGAWKRLSSRLAYCLNSYLLWHADIYVHLVKTVNLE